MQPITLTILLRHVTGQLTSQVTHNLLLTIIS